MKEENQNSSPKSYSKILIISIIAVVIIILILSIFFSLKSKKDKEEFFEKVTESLEQGAVLEDQDIGESQQITSTELSSSGDDSGTSSDISTDTSIDTSTDQTEISLEELIEKLNVCVENVEEMGNCRELFKDLRVEQVCESFEDLDEKDVCYSLAGIINCKDETEINGLALCEKILDQSGWGLKSWCEGQCAT